MTFPWELIFVLFFWFKRQITKGHTWAISALHTEKKMFTCYIESAMMSLLTWYSIHSSFPFHFKSFLRSVHVVIATMWKLLRLTRITICYCIVSALLFTLRSFLTCISKTAPSNERKSGIKQQKLYVISTRVKSPRMRRISVLLFPIRHNPPPPSAFIPLYHFPIHVCCY